MKGHLVLAVSDASSQFDRRPLLRAFSYVCSLLQATRRTTCEVQPCSMAEFTPYNCQITRNLLWAAVSYLTGVVSHEQSIH